MLSNRKIELISFEVIKTLFSRFENFPIDTSNNRNAPFHKAFLKAFSDKFENKVSDIPFFITLSSWLHGLNTTLGQSFFENVAHILSDGQKMEFTNTRNTQLKTTTEQKNAIADIITDLKNKNKEPSLSRENQLIFNNNGQVIEANNFTVDVYFEDENKIVCVELKSVKPNAGEMRGEKQKILEAKAALYRQFHDKEILYFIGFPFDPTSEISTGCNKIRFLNSIIDGKKYYDLDEVLLADELWNYLASDENIMQQILNIINQIATPDFIDKYNKLISTQIDISLKKDICQEWNLHSELSLLKNDALIKANFKNSKSLSRIYKQTCFKKGNYNTNRYNMLRKNIE